MANSLDNAWEGEGGRLPYLLIYIASMVWERTLVIDLIMGTRGLTL